jgi:dTDP-4-dehydrorhamnose reductase
MKSVLILGSQGMLGSSVTELFVSSGNYNVNVVNRDSIFEGNHFDASSRSTFEIIKNLESDWIINCIGVIKPYINDKDSESTKNAFRVNSEFPSILSRIAEKSNAKVIQIATDCVYSGSKGTYNENDAHDPVDVYGESKSAGEVISSNFMNLRCSIVGRDSRNNKSLLEWFLSQDVGSKVRGYTDHQWNGITTNAFARICKGIIEENLFIAGTLHQIPADSLSKAELLEIFREKFNRHDLIIEKISTGEKIDRTINTIDPDSNKDRWISAGYSDIPTIKELVNEIS